MKKRIVVLGGDGVGPEVTAQAVRVLDAIAAGSGHQFEYRHELIGGAAMDAGEAPLPARTLGACKEADAILLGAVGGPKWSDPSAKVRPEQGLLGLREELGLFANLRPVTIHPALIDASPVRPERLEGTDMLVVRELTGGAYFGDKTDTGDAASDLCVYTEAEVERVVRIAGNMARARRGRLTSVDKANVLATSRLWRRVVDRVMQSEFSDVEVVHLLVDAAAMHLIQRPADFDVIVTENLFGDILTDEASVLSGSMGMLPSASLSDSGPGLYEPIHGSAPDIAGQGIANPFAAILSVAMMLKHSLGLAEEAGQVEAAVNDAIEKGVRTADIAGGGPAVTTAEAGDAVIAGLTVTA